MPKQVPETISYTQKWSEKMDMVYSGRDFAADFLQIRPRRYPSLKLTVGTANSRSGLAP